MMNLVPRAQRLLYRIGKRALVSMLLYRIDSGIDLFLRGLFLADLSNRRHSEAALDHY